MRFEKNPYSYHPFGLSSFMKSNIQVWQHVRFRRGNSSNLIISSGLNDVNILSYPNNVLYEEYRINEACSVLFFLCYMRDYRWLWWNMQENTGACILLSRLRILKVVYLLCRITIIIENLLWMIMDFIKVICQVILRPVEIQMSYSLSRIHKWWKNKNICFKTIPSLYQSDFRCFP